MGMLPKDFLNKQANGDIRDVLNFLNGYLSSFQNIDWHLENKDGLEKGQKVDYKLNGKIILAIWIRKSKKPIFRCNVLDRAKSLTAKRLYESGRQWEDEGWRNFKFDISDEDLRLAKNLFQECIELNS